MSTDGYGEVGARSGTARAGQGAGMGAKRRETETGYGGLVDDAAGTGLVQFAIFQQSVLLVEAMRLRHRALSERERHVVDFGRLEQLVPGSEEVVLGVAAHVGEAARSADSFQLLGLDQVERARGGLTAFAIRGLDHDTALRLAGR
jgi:hypothetical protein